VIVIVTVTVIVTATVIETATEPGTSIGDIATRT